tara:strand:- start:313 stop:2298 length:1986 start_codon:yes stop_codon:yes gene_type:complete
MEKKNLGFNYLNHVDALRAISVIFVILFHLNPKVFSYGFLGVDIFFVISGYVITNSLYDQQIRKKESIFYFYVKRVKRIFPILFLVIFSFLITYIFLSPLKGDTNFFLESAMSSLVGLSNLYFINNEINYFFTDEINPLLHTWSLGIEEQFYLIYPVLLVLIYKALKGNIEKISGYIFLLIIISFTVYYFEDGVIGNFYSPVARFWEIGLGCFAFFYSSISIKKKNFLFYFFCFLLFYLFLNFQNEKVIQHINLLAAVVSFIFIIKFKNLNFNLFIEKTGLPYIGKLSYSLYLWHLPVLYFCEIYFSGIELYFIFFIISLSLSILSYHFYENPIRKSEIFNLIIIRLFKNLQYLLVIFLIFLIIGFNNFKIVRNYDFLKKFNYPERKLQKYLTRLDHSHAKYLKTNCSYENNLRRCFKNKDLKNSIYLTGDSHSDHFLVSIDNIDFISSYFHNDFAQCKIIFNSMHNTKELNSLNNCKKKYQKNYEKIIIDELNNTQKNAIVISLRLSDYLSSDWKLIKDIKYSKKDTIINNYQEFISLFPKKNIILITTVPESKAHSDKCIFNEFLRNKVDMKTYNKCHFKKSNDKKRYDDIKEILSKIASKNFNVKIYDPYPILCPLNLCHNYNKETDFFMLHDQDHLSIEASKFISKDLSSFLKNNYN